MCAVSVILDHYHDKYTKKTWYPTPYVNPPPFSPYLPNITRDEFDNLRKELLELKELIEKLKEYDNRTHQSDCEKPELVAALRRIANALNVNLDEALGDHAKSLKK